MCAVKSRIPFVCIAGVAPAPKPLGAMKCVICSVCTVCDMISNLGHRVQIHLVHGRPRPPCPVVFVEMPVNTGRLVGELANLSKPQELHGIKVNADWLLAATRC